MYAGNADQRNKAELSSHGEQYECKDNKDLRMKLLDILWFWFLPLVDGILSGFSWYIGAQYK